MILLLLAVAIAAGILQVHMARLALRSVTCAIRSEQYLCEPDAPFPLVLTVENHSRIPVFFLRVRTSVPLGSVLAPGSTGSVTAYATTAQYSFLCFLMPRQRLTHRFLLTIPRRGRYVFSDLRIAAGDFLGLKEQEENRPGFCEVVVLPAKPDRPVLPDSAGGLMGERSVRRWIHEDPILSAGFREYTGREPQKTIAWNRSLQSGRLMVRQMDHTAEERITVLLSLDDGTGEELEACFRLCRGVCEELEARHFPYAFCHNGQLFTSVGLLLPVDAGLGKQHLNRILEGLGRALPICRENLPTLVRRVWSRSDTAGSCLLIVPRESEAARRQAAALSARTGAPVTILSAEVLP